MLEGNGDCPTNKEMGPFLISLLKKKIRNRLDKTLLLVSPESAATKQWETFLMWRVPYKIFLFFNIETSWNLWVLQGANNNSWCV